MGIRFCYRLQTQGATFRNPLRRRTEKRRIRVRRQAVAASYHLLGVDRWRSRHGSGDAKTFEELEIDGKYCSLYLSVEKEAEESFVATRWRMDPHTVGGS